MDKRTQSKNRKRDGVGGESNQMIQMTMITAINCCRETQQKKRKERKKKIRKQNDEKRKAHVELVVSSIHHRSHHTYIKTEKSISNNNGRKTFIEFSMGDNTKKKSNDSTR